MIALDANLLVYAADSGAGPRHVAAKELTKSIIRAGRLFLPLQVLAEVYNVLTRKFHLPPSLARAFVDNWRRAGSIASYDPADLEKAMQAHAAHGLAFWDALIWSVCERAAVPILLSEDFQDGRRLGAVTFLDPFAPANAGRIARALA